jgi:hypothetical protein
MSPIKYSIVIFTAAFVSTTAFGQTTDRLPESINLMELHKALEKANLKYKGDEEKTVAYEARVNAFRHKGKAIVDEMSITFRPSSTEACKRKVDADNETIGFSCHLESLGNMTVQGLEIRLSEQKKNLGTYVGSNAYNVRTRITQREVNRVALLAIPTIATTHEPVYSTSIEVKGLNVSSTNYQREYEKFKIVVGYKLKHPYIGQVISEKTPTLSVPDDVTTFTTLVLGTVTRVHVFRNDETEPIKKLIPVYRPGKGLFTVHTDFVDES